MSFRVEEAKKAFNGAAPNDDRHFINKRLQKPRHLNLKFVTTVNNENKTNGRRYNSQSCQFHVKIFIANSNSNCCSRGISGET
jgi:hypothetical protein